MLGSLENKMAARLSGPDFSRTIFVKSRFYSLTSSYISVWMMNTAYKLVSCEAIISKAPPVVYLAYTAGCSAIFVQPQEGEELWFMVCGLSSREKNGRGRVKSRGHQHNPTRGTLVCSLRSPFIDHLSRDTSGFIYGLIGTC